MEFDIVPRYAAVLGLGLMLLSMRVIRLRRSVDVPIGDGGQPALERAVRAQANYCEYVPLAVLLLAFMELTGNPDWVLHTLCIALLAGRAIHAIGLSRIAEDYRYRVTGMTVTFTVIGAASAFLLIGGALESLPG